MKTIYYILPLFLLLFPLKGFSQTNTDSSYTAQAIDLYESHKYKECIPLLNQAIKLNKENGKAEDSLFNQITVKVDETILYYPDHACRVDSAYHGAICTRVGELSDTDETAGVCHKANGDKHGSRPRCWFKPGVK